jgi:hypothetical protein
MTIVTFMRFRFERASILKNDGARFVQSTKAIRRSFNFGIKEEHL